LSNPNSVTDFLYPEDGNFNSEIEMDVDKAWHGIHYLLCGKQWDGDPPLSFIVCGGTSVGDVDVGYGPARVYFSNEVTEIANALEPINTDQLREKYNSEEFIENNIYPEKWEEPISECLDNYVLHYFNELKEFILKAKNSNQGIIVFLN